MSKVDSQSTIFCQNCCYLSEKCGVIYSTKTTGSEWLNIASVHTCLLICKLSWLPARAKPNLWPNEWLCNNKMDFSEALYHTFAYLCFDGFPSILCIFNLNLMIFPFYMHFYQNLWIFMLGHSICKSIPESCNHVREDLRLSLINPI